MNNRLRSSISVLALLGILVSNFASAQTQYPTPTSGSLVPGMATLVPKADGSTGAFGQPIYVPPSTTNPLQIAGTVGGKTASVCVTPTITISNSYGANYVVGGLLTFANAFGPAGSGILQEVVVTMKDQETSGFTFIPFIANPTATTLTDAAIAAINAADVPKVWAPVSLSSNIQFAATLFSVQYAYGLGIPLVPGATTLYGVLLANAALTNQFAGTGDVQVCVGVLQD